MLPVDEMQQRWLQLQSDLTIQSGKALTLDDVLILIGKKESGRTYLNELSDKLKTDLRQLGICSILVSAKYYELIWVDDIGWPHFKQLQQLPNNPEERANLFKNYVLLYTERIKLENLVLPEMLN